MKLNAAVKVGLLAGLVISLCLHFTVFLIFYATAYDFTVPGWVSNTLLAIGWPIIIVSALAFGPLAIRAAGDSVRSWRDAALVGGGAGLVIGVMVHLLLAGLALVMVLGVVPFIVPLQDPTSIAGAPVDDVLRPIIQQGIVGYYTSLAGGLLSWVAGGALEGVIYRFVRPLLKRKAKAIQPA